MDSYRREQTDHRSLQVNQGITEDIVDGHIYRPRIPATAFLPDVASGAVFAPGVASVLIAFPNAVTPAARYSQIPPEAWVSGNLSGIDLIWSGDTASTNNVSWQINGHATLVGAGPVGIGLVAPTLVAGPAVAGALIKTHFNASALVPINAAHVLYGIVIFRNAAVAGDTYAGIAWLYGVRLFYTPVAGH